MQQLSQEECRDLLLTDVIGRVAYVTPDGPRVLPVNYKTHDNAVVLRTASSSELAVYATNKRVAFEIDHVDAERKRGWSVLVVGTCEREDTLPSAYQMPGDQPEPWADGQRALMLRITIEQISGRRVGDGFWPFPVVSGRGRGY